MYLRCRENTAREQENDNVNLGSISMLIGKSECLNWQDVIIMCDLIEGKLSLQGANGGTGCSGNARHRNNFKKPSRECKNARNILRIMRTARMLYKLQISGEGDIYLLKINPHNSSSQEMGIGKKRKWGLSQK